MDGTTSLTRTRGVKLASTVTLEHSNVQASHECSVSLTKRSKEASSANSVKITLPFIQMEMSHELGINTRTKLNVLSKKKLSYMFNVPKISSVGKGSLDVTWDLEALSSHVLLKSSTKGKSEMMIMDTFNVASNLENIKSFYITIIGVRTTDQTSLTLKMDQEEKQKRSVSSNLFLFDLENMVASDVSLRRVVATVQCKSNNNVEFEPFTMNGKHFVGGELDVVPLQTLKPKLKYEAEQFISLGDAGVSQEVNIMIGSDRQSFSCSLKGHLGSVFHGSDWNLFNEGPEAGMAFSGSVGGHLAFLKAIRLPVYQRTLWDVLKFDEVSNINDVQFFNFSSAVIYTKSTDGYDYQIPALILEDGVMFSLPVFTIAVPSWIKEKMEVPDQVHLPPAVPIPAFHVPFTSLHTESFIVDPKNLMVPKMITTKAFDIKLPILPLISVPSYEINTEYVQDKMSFLSFRVPQYEISLSSFTFPKSVSIGDLAISLDDFTTHISNFKLPPIVIPEQKVEVPEVVLHLPSSIFIPSFGALSATLNISSPVYKVSTTASVGNQASILEGTVSSTCSSTMVFLEYNLSASAAVRSNNEMFHVNGNGRLSHSDVNVNWRHVLDHPIRIKRQISRGDSVNRESRHTLDVDISSRMFTDTNIRLASRKDSITVSVWSPSAGFLGLHLQRRSSTQLQGKVFSRYLSSPGKDTNLLTARASLRNSDKLVLQTSWNWDGVNDLITVFKERIPLMTNALYRFINKYHTSHFGFDLNRGFMKLRNAVLTLIEKVYQVVEVSLSTVEDFVQTAVHQGKVTYINASDILKSTDMVELTDVLIEKVHGGFKHMRSITEVGPQPVSNFFNVSVPWSERKVSITETFPSLMEMISQQIRRTTITIPGTEVVVDGNKIIENLMMEAVAVRHHFIEFFKRTFRDVLELLAEKAEQLRLYVEDQNRKVSPLVHEAHRNFRTFSREHSDQAKSLVSECKDLVRQKVHETYNAFSMERVNSATKGFISQLQSNLSESVNESLDVMKKVSQSAAPYVRVGKEKVDVEVPLPFLWKSFSEWPTP